MQLIKYDNFWNDPFAELDRALDRSFGSRAGLLNSLGAFFSAQPEAFRLDIYDDANNYYVIAELPGVEKSAVEISLENAVLSITGKREEVVGGAESGSRQTVTLRRSVTVSDEIDADRVSAKLENGLLRVTLPKAESRKPRAITVS